VHRTTWAAAAGLVEPRSYRRSERVLWRSTARGMVILPPQGEPLALVGPAAAMWDLLANRLGHRELSERLSARFAVPVSDVEDLITPVLDHLVDAGAVVLDER
jgi:hypothetical protein